ncbi:hypothetical protein Misp01_48930 [Microtetraspora sp. NBRC 13810]|uniref:hypothetical protein n=1 Tax=Microtetraspora sp. NBRC 13810 TaxID=3030990 RepID=UPI0024A37411|nr:hypothetical protein [Microtetraspora sp. NBRC 13810]GLW09764.1 hypothetical protein Misp01_48930 [Microtetraspora sp. NBRC 13810]
MKAKKTAVAALLLASGLTLTACGLLNATPPHHDAVSYETPAQSITVQVQTGPA